MCVEQMHPDELRSVECGQGAQRVVHHHVGGPFVSPVEVGGLALKWVMVDIEALCKSPAALRGKGAENDSPPSSGVNTIASRLQLYQLKIPLPLQPYVVVVDQEFTQLEDVLL